LAKHFFVGLYLPNFGSPRSHIYSNRRVNKKKKLSM